MDTDIAVGLSGGVDSAVAALLLLRGGLRPAGVTMKLWREGRYHGGCGDACFGPGEERDLDAAAGLARQLGIPYMVFDCSEQYEKNVLDYYRSERLAGRTPNPCIVCNSSMKFGFLPELAAKHVSTGRFATGHYARVARRDGRFAAAMAFDEKKDQSYFLCRLSQEQLSRAVFPLGEMEKKDVRRIAAQEGFSMAAKPDSQDFYSGNPEELLGVKPKEGNIVDAGGRVLGRHEGYWRYTPGQRQGLRIGGGVPYYVMRIDPCRNEVVVGRREDVFSTAFNVTGVVWQLQEPTDGEVSGRVKIRSAGAPVAGAVFRAGRIEVPDGIFGVAPGQSAVLYSNDGAILCSGVISGF